MISMSLNNCCEICQPLSPLSALFDKWNSQKQRYFNTFNVSRCKLGCFKKTFSVFMLWSFKVFAEGFHVKFCSLYCGEGCWCFLRIRGIAGYVQKRKSREKWEKSDACCSFLPPVVPAGEVGSHKNGLMCHTKEFFVDDQALPLLTTTARITKQNICWPLSPGAGQVWPGVGGICCWVQLISPACSPSCTHSQELEIFQSALLLSFFFW